MQNIYIIDTTLRDGEQAPGVSFTAEEKIKLVLFLNDLGIDEIEAGTPAMGNEEIGIIQEMTRLRLKSELLVWSRALKEDVLRSIKTGVERIHVALPISLIQLQSMSKSHNHFISNFLDLIKLLEDNFAFISVGLQDASRCTYDDLAHVIECICTGRIDRVRIADTVGILTPMETYTIVSKLCSDFSNLTFDFHAHNDLGLATANSVVAYSAGAKCISATINGLGERAGNAALEELLMILYIKNNVDKYKLSSLNMLCQYVSNISRRPISDNKPIVGKLVFSHESGIHVKGTLNSLLAFQPFTGDCIGREKYSILFGKHTGKGGLVDLLNRNSIFLDDMQFLNLLDRIKHESCNKKKCFTEDEIIKYFIM